MSAPVISIEFTPQAKTVAAKLQKLPGLILPAIARGLQQANAKTVPYIQDKYLSFGKGGPPTPEGLRVQSNDYRRSLRATTPTISGDTVITSIGTNITNKGFSYPALHEFGGQFTRTTQIGPHLVRLRTDSSGNLLRQGKNGKLAIFAKKTHARAKTVAYAGGKTFTVTYPARRPIQRGIEDNRELYTRLVSAKIMEAVK